MKLTGHKTEAVYRRYAIVPESDLAEAVGRLHDLRKIGVGQVSGTTTGTTGENRP